jgi:hypothetical protein
MSAAYARAGHGVPSERLPAYRLQEPMASWLAGYLPQMAHWNWSEPPHWEITGAPPGDAEFAPLSIRVA